MPLLIHVAETQLELKNSQAAHAGMSPVGYLQSIGFWGPRTVANHGVWVSADDIRILRGHRIAVSHNPESNMKLASGIAPVPEYLAAGVTVGLGTDGAASNNDLDMFEAMRAAAFLHKVKTGDPRTIPRRRHSNGDDRRRAGLGSRRRLDRSNRASAPTLSLSRWQAPGKLRI